MQNKSAIARDVIPLPPLFAGVESERRPSHQAALDSVSDYLKRHYWWAYVHPNAVRVFERDWLVNLILWGNYPRLRNAASAGDPAAAPRTRLVRPSSPAVGQPDVSTVRSLSASRRIPAPMALNGKTTWR